MDRLAMSARTGGMARLRVPTQRSNARGLARLLGHLTLMIGSGVLYGLAMDDPDDLLWSGVFGLFYGFTLVTMFAAMHECVHHTAFESAWLNDGVGWFAGLLSFYNSTFYRPYHTFHHRFTQIAGKDPELTDTKPSDPSSYLLELSGAPWWRGKLQTYWRIVRGDTKDYPFLNAKTRGSVIRSVRTQMALYLAAIALSLALEEPYFLVYWLAPVLLAQPFLRAILLAEHTGCSEDDNPLSNTRTTRTLWLVRFLMWEMPFHAEHHRYPAVPFFALSSLHEQLGPELKHVAQRGYTAFNLDLLRKLDASSTRGRTA
jgi:fatty acid desaturase